MSLRMPILLILVGRLLGATALKRSFKRRRGFGQDAQDGLSRSHIVEWQACTGRSEEHTSELQSLMRISYAVFCLKKKNNHNPPHPPTLHHPPHYHTLPTKPHPYHH